MFKSDAVADYVLYEFLRNDIIYCNVSSHIHIENNIAIFFYFKSFVFMQIDLHCRPKSCKLIDITLILFLLHRNELIISKN